ncbi:L,D-transpeptidase [Nocardioides pantholopis]|uniref:L,D-transpeptidase n=1 Tax=Nocardioides pantholopis TaxID=2483798 RepID=UPI000FD827CB|nr:Ig-like domain-containing protein [Nocardioides pantholopis]
MSARRVRTSRAGKTATRPLLAAGSTAVLALTLLGCSGSTGAGSGDGPGDGPGEASGAPESAGPAPTIDLNVRRGASGVPVDTRVTASARNGELKAVEITSPAGDLAGALEGTRFTAADLLEPGTTYRVRAVALGAEGERTVLRSRFSTADLTLDQQTYASVAPLDGETVGVGMPVAVTFDRPVTDRAAFEQHLEVTSTPAQRGSWHWLSDSEVHWRPKAYWQPGTRVQVDLGINGVAAGNGIYGQESRSLSFRVGEAHIYRVDGRSHQMKVFANGELLRTIPVTLGKAGFTTRSGTKVIMGKDETRRMSSETVGIAAGSADAYDIDDVRWAMRLTTSGEFIHAAPWSVGSQGRDNVSHGCTGLSTEDAGWLYELSRRGDVVEYTGTDRQMTVDNGYGDWNVDFAQYRRGSALR